MTHTRLAMTTISKAIVFFEIRMTSLIFFLVICFSLVFNGLCRTSFPSKQELKIIKTKYGVYDCVDFYKQPAFNHPLLKHHASKVMPKMIEELQRRKVNGFGLQDGCPIGTVPISRTNPNSHWGEDPPPPQPKLIHCVAGVQTTDDSNRKFVGVSGTLLLYKPRVNDNGQYSSARIKLINGEDSVEAGWLVSPKVFNDSEAHMYVSFSVGDKEGDKEGCVNLQCFGFVQIAPDAPLGLPPNNYSFIGGQQWSWDFSIEKHKDDGNWWVNVAEAKKAIGYWPKEIFDTLVDVAKQVEWGGEVYDFGLKNPPSPLPGMGSGVKGSYISSAAAIYHATYVNENYTNVTNPERTNVIANCDSDYVVVDDGFVENFGRALHFGGVLEN